MTGCDHLVEIPTADWTELRQLFQCDWPKHEFAYYLLGNYETWKGHHETLDVKCYSLNGNWRTDGSFLLKDGFEIYFYSKADDNNWTVLVQLLSLIGWDAFNEISMDYLEKFHPAVERIISDKCLTVSSSKCANYYFLPKEQALTLHSSTIPKGFTLSRLQLKDLDTIYAQWPLRNHISYEAGYGLLKRLILLNENVGLFNETGVLVSWCLSDQTGAHSDLQTTAACCRRGYGRMVVEELARRLARSGSDSKAIAWEELPELLDLYREEWPRYAYTFYTLENGYRWRELAPVGELEVFTDPERNWQTTGTFVLRDCKELFFFTLEATFESLEKVLRAVMSRMGTSVSLVYDCCFRAVVDRTIAVLSLAKSSDERMVCYRQLAPCDDGKDPHGELQQGYRFSAVKPEDSAVVEAHWVHNDPIFTNLPTRLIKRNPSLGVYDRHDRLVAWCLM
uniref:GCN5-related N-acetyltransferase Rv2170-like domain-containing protein n=1 Tax=Anopheles stephensi TaxID=30069 RepID=A0A182YN60_ANOST